MHGKGKRDKARDERYTPEPIITACKQALGIRQFHFDPCASEDLHFQFAAINWTKTQQRELGASDDSILGFAWPKVRSVFVNPPGTLLEKFVEAFIVAGMHRRFQKGAFLLFNHDHSTKTFERLYWSGPSSVVLLKNRWKFPNAEGELFEVGRSQTLFLYGKRDINLRAFAFEGECPGYVLQR